MRLTTVLAVVVAVTGAAWGQVAPSGSHAASKPTDTGFATQVNSSGGLAATVPLNLPPAKQGLPVPLSVVYGGRAVGAAGMGWDIPLSYIIRDTSYAHRLPWYDDTVTNPMRGTTVPRGVEQLILVMEGQPTRLMRKGDPRTSTTWIPVQDGPQLEVHEDASHGSMVMYDGDGRTFTFVNKGPVGPPGQPPTGNVPLLDGKLYMLTTIVAPGNKVLTEYVNIAYPLRGGGTGLEISLHSIAYNRPTSTSNCFKNRIVLSYNPPKIDAGAYVPRSMTMIGSGILVRMATLKWIDVHAFDRCSGATDLILRRHFFGYDDDPDTGLPRLTSVGVSGRQGSAEANKILSLGQFAYGEASIVSGTRRVLRYDLQQTVLLPTEGRALGESLSNATDRGTWSQLVDMTGDGRPDLVHQVAGGNAFVITANGPTAGGGTSFSVTNDVPPSVLAAPDKPLQREWISNSPSDLDVTMAGRRGRDQDVWRQLIDVNGDGRVDVVDAREVAGEWVVYLNTPGPTSWQIRWRRMRVDVAKLKQVLRDHNHPVDDFVPLSRRHTGMEGLMTATFTCTGSTACEPGSDRWMLTFNGVPFDTFVGQLTYVEWELRDVNGDGYVDVVFNDVGGVTDTEVPVRPDVTANPGTQAEGWLRHIVTLPATGVDVVYNLVGPLLSGGENGISLYPFSAPVQIWSADHSISIGDRATDLPPKWTPLSNFQRCGVALWVQGQPIGEISRENRPEFIDLSTQYCGFADINGDGLVDRVEGITAHLQGGEANFGATTMVLPSYMQGSSSDNRVLCCNDRNSPCDDDVSRSFRFNAYQEFALKDINGDGILDYLDQRMFRPTLVISQGVRLGTGAGFGPALTLQSGNTQRDILASYESQLCPGFFEVADAHTLIGFYDLDGDGKAEMVDSDGQVFALNNGSQADWGRPGAGRLINIDNGHGALTRITYRSAKEDLRLLHQVPFPEIVATKLETVKTSDGTPLATEVDHAFGNAEMVFDSLAKRWRFLGYRNQITMQRDGSGNGRMTVTDRYELPPLDGALPWTPLRRFLVNSRAGRPKDVTVMAGAMSDAWAEVGVGPNDPRAIASTHYDYDSQMVTEPADPTVAFCREMTDPYDYQRSLQLTTAWPVCVTHGFTFVNLTASWRGTAAPPSEHNAKTFMQIDRDSYGRVTSEIRTADETLEVALGYATPTAAPGSNAPRFLNAVKHRIEFAFILAIDVEETWQYDGDDPDSPSGTISNGFMTTHTVIRHKTHDGRELGRLRTSFAWDPTANPATGALTSVTTARADPSGHADGASRTLKLENYDDFKLAPKQLRLDAVSASGAPPVPSLVTTLEPDSFTLAVERSTDANGTLQGTYRDGFDRTCQTFAGTSSGPLKITSTTSYAGFFTGEAGPRQVTSKTFVDLNTPPSRCDVPGPPPTTPGISSTVYLDELARPSYTATQLGSSYGGQTLITDAQIYDLWGRTAFAADPYLSSQALTSAYGTSSYFQVDGMPDCIIRGPAGPAGPHELTRTTDEAHEVYPTCFQRSFSSQGELIEAREPDSLLVGSPQFGVVHSVTKSAMGRVLSQSTKQNNVPLELTGFVYNELGQMLSMIRFLDPALPLKSSITDWSWDSMGQVLELGESGVASRQRSYSNWGELVEESWTDTSTSPSTIHRISYRYDALGRLVHSEESRQSGTATPVVDPDSVNDYTYDTGTPLLGGTVDFAPTHLAGRLARAVSPTQTVSLSYDDLGRLNGQAFSDGELYVETFEYHNDGTLDKLHLFLPDHLDNGGHSVDEYATYSYDSMRRLNGVSYADGATSEALFNGTRDVLGRITQGQYAATTVTASYAPAGRRLLTSWTVANSDQSHSRRIIPQAQGGAGVPPYDPVGRERGRTEIPDGDPAHATTSRNEYGALDRLQRQTRTYADTPILNTDYDFSYDALGNLTELRAQNVIARSVALTYPATGDLDRICRIRYNFDQGTACNVQYDALGNTTRMLTIGGNTRSIDYFADGAVRVISDDAGNRAEYRYDAFGNVARLEIDSPSVGSTRNDRHYGSAIAVRDEIVGGAAGPVVTRSIPGDDGILATRHGPTSTWTFTFGEQRGNRFFTDRSGNFIQEEDYSAFGHGMGPPPVEKRLATYSSAKWNGGDTLEAFDLAQLGARIYDPVIGRFLSRDPLIVPRTAATTNPYTFAINDPINVSDPSGADIDGLMRAYYAREAAELWAETWALSYQFGLLLARASISIDEVSADLLIGGRYHFNRAAGMLAAEDWRQYDGAKRWSEDWKQYYHTDSFNEFIEKREHIRHREYIESHPNASRVEGLIMMAGVLPVGRVAGVAERVLLAGSERLALEAAGGTLARAGAGVTTVYRIEGAMNQRLLIDASGNVSIQKGNMLFLNFGDAARAKQFLATRVAQEMQGATMKSFQVPTSFVDELAASAVPEWMARRFPNAPLVVDVTKAANQFGLRPAQVEALEQAIIQGSGR